MNVLIKYNEEEDTFIDIGKYTYEERLAMKKYIENAIKKIRETANKKLNDKKH